MARFVLLHSPVLGPQSWRRVAEALFAAGAAGETPPLPRLSEIDGGYYEAIGEGTAAWVRPGPPPVLVAHSGAGAILPAVAARLPEIAGAIFVDAILPHPGRSWFETAPAELRHHLKSGARDGLLPSWDAWWPPGALDLLVPEEPQRQILLSELEPIPVAWFEAVAPAGEAPGASAYLQLSDAYEDEARIADRQGWPLVRLPLNHLAPVSQPAAVAAALIDLAEELARKG